MSRPLRLEFAGAPYHVMARGNARELIFADAADRDAFLEGLARARARFDCMNHGVTILPLPSTGSKEPTPRRCAEGRMSVCRVDRRLVFSVGCGMIPPQSPSWIKALERP